VWHKGEYFSTEKYLVYFEIRHIIKLECSRLFKNDIDIQENMILLCSNCHRKLCNAQEHVVKKLVIKIYNGTDKKFGLKTVFL
jgi:5-methylcytosine-specific restriction endonuclease McrA